MNYFYTAIILLSIIITIRVSLGDDESWKVPLAKKAKIFEENVLERHWIEGLYPSSVEVPLDGSPVDQTTSGYSNIAHSICWTANYIGGQCYRYAFTKDEKVREHVNQVFLAMYRCQLVTGVKGLQARGYALGHGESYEEREGSNKSDFWRQGKGKYSNYRWRGDPSHHNYSDAIFGYGIYYDMVAEGKYKELCKEAVYNLVSYWLDNDMIINKYDRSRQGVPILGFTDGKTPNTRIIMAAAGLKVAHHVTGDPKFDAAYQKLVDQYGFRKWDRFPQPMRRRTGHDDAEHVFCHLENLFRIEKDPELLAFYRKVADALWANHKDDCQSLFNYIYISLTPNSPDREKALKDALWTLQSYPTNKIFRPRMNSIRKDIEIVDGMAKEPLPMYESPWDNEYQWKGNLYQLDGWLARPIVSVAVPEEDSMVIYACDTRGDIYKTVDAGANWREISQNLAARALKLATSKRIRMLFVAADNGFYKTTTAGMRWIRMPLPNGSGAPTDIMVDRENPNVLYAITNRGVYRSIDYGEKWLGERWICLSDDLPPANRMRFAIGLGKPTMIYAVLDDDIFSKAIKTDATRWEHRGQLGIGSYAQTYPWLIIDPNSPTTLYSGLKSTYPGFEASFLSISKDCGKSWTRDLQSLYHKYAKGGMEALMRGRISADISDLAVDPRDSSVLYIATSEGVMRSSDGGETWKLKNEGLDIPRPSSIFAPRNSNKIYVSTPAGLFESEDKGEHWRDANLCLIFRSNTKREVGSADYLDAYWRGRYFGFITDEQANEKFWK